MIYTGSITLHAEIVENGVTLSVTPESVSLQESDKDQEVIVRIRVVDGNAVVPYGGSDGFTVTRLVADSAKMSYEAISGREAEPYGCEFCHKITVLSAKVFSVDLPYAITYKGITYQYSLHIGIMSKPQSAFVVDADNELIAVPVVNAGKAFGIKDKQIRVNCWYNGEQILSGITYDVENSNTELVTCRQVEGNLFSVSVASNKDWTRESKVTLTIRASHGKYGSGRAQISLVPSFPGADGMIYSLRPTHSSLVFNRRADGSLRPSASFRVTIVRHAGASITELGIIPKDSDLVLSWSFDDNKYTPFANDSLSKTVTAAEAEAYQQCYIKLSDGSTVLDKESIPIIKDGKKGADGNGVDEIVNYYKKSSDGSKAPAIDASYSGWSPEPPVLDAVEKYLWNFEIVSYSKTGSKPTSPHIVGVYGKDGLDGRNITGIDEEYAVSQYRTDSPDSLTWENDVPEGFNSVYRFLWNRETVHFDKGTPNPIVQPAHIVSVYGKDGEPGAPGTPGADGKAPNVNLLHATSFKSFGTDKEKWNTRITSEYVHSYSEAVKGHLAWFEDRPCDIADVNFAHVKIANGVADTIFVARQNAASRMREHTWYTLTFLLKGDISVYLYDADNNDHTVADQQMLVDGSSYNANLAPISFSDSRGEWHKHTITFHTEHFGDRFDFLFRIFFNTEKFGHGGNSGRGIYTYINDGERPESGIAGQGYLSGGHLYIWDRHDWFDAGICSYGAGNYVYVHLAYAKSDDGSDSFSVTDVLGRAYIGKLINTEETDSSVYGEYAWSLNTLFTDFCCIKLEKGKEATPWRNSERDSRGATPEYPIWTEGETYLCGADGEDYFTICEAHKEIDGSPVYYECTRSHVAKQGVNDPFISTGSHLGYWKPVTKQSLVLAGRIASERIDTDTLVVKRFYSENRNKDRWIKMSDGMIEIGGTTMQPNICVGLDENGCAILEFYDNAGKFCYGLGPSQIGQVTNRSERWDAKHMMYLADDINTAFMGYRWRKQSITGKVCYQYFCKIVAGKPTGEYANENSKYFKSKVIVPQDRLNGVYVAAGPPIYAIRATGGESYPDQLPGNIVEGEGQVYMRYLLLFAEGILVEQQPVYWTKAQE